MQDARDAKITDSIRSVEGRRTGAAFVREEERKNRVRELVLRFCAAGQPERKAIHHHAMGDE